MGALALLLIFAAAPAMAHPLPHADVHHVLTHLSFEPWVTIPMLVAAGLYAAGVVRLWSHAGKGRGISGMQVACFTGGWLSLAIALVSPLDALGSQLFSAHMVQHEILMLITAPLMVLSRPLAAWTWAFPAAQRHRVGHAVQARWWSAVWGVITDPLVAWALHAIALWGWHVPQLFEAALDNEAIHALQHASFLGTALLFWWAVLGRDARDRKGTGAAMAYLFTTMLHTGALGALLTLAPTPWYPHYAVTASLFGLDPVEDQQLGGLVMWVPGGAAYLFAALAIMARLLSGRAARSTRAAPGPIRSSAWRAQEPHPPRP